MLCKIHENFHHQGQQLLGLEVALFGMLHLQLNAARSRDGLEDIVEHSSDSIGKFCPQERVQHMLRQLLHHRQHFSRCLEAPACLTVHGLQVLLLLISFLLWFSIPSLSVSPFKLDLPDVSQLKKALVNTVNDVIQHHVDETDELSHILALFLQSCDVIRKFHNVHEQFRHVMSVMKFLVELVVGVIAPCHLDINVEANEGWNQELACNVMLLEQSCERSSSQLEPFVPPARYQKAHHLQQLATQVGILDIYIIGREYHQEVEEVLQGRHAHQLQGRDVRLSYHPQDVSHSFHAELRDGFEHGRRFRRERQDSGRSISNSQQPAGYQASEEKKVVYQVGIHQDHVIA
mmetsp:Transcript_27873/g.63060  ORF Transcript_27873/g.63060 Transcript_27873/m.63060 type:complete len:347 (-) Transcript_27873:1426-2466(-)